MVLKKLLGKIMTDMGLITEQQLDEVLQRQREIFKQTALPEKVERAQLVSQARKATDRTPMLGQILKDMGFATEEQLEEALKKQDRITGVYGTIGSAKLGAALEIGSIVNSTLDLAEVLALIMRYVNRVTNSAASTLMVLDDKTKELVFSVPTGPKAERLIDARLAPGKGIAGWVAEHGQPILVPNVREDPRFYAEIDNMSGFETQSILCVPLKVKTKLIGVLEAINKTDGTSFTEEDELLMSIFAYQAAMAIENARLYGELRDGLEQEKQMRTRLEEEIVERKQAEEALRHSEERYRSVVEGSIEGIVVVQDFITQFANRAAAQIFGYSNPEDLIGLDFSESFFAPQERAELRRRASDILSGRPVPIHHGWQAKRKDGRPIWIQSAGSLISWNDKPAILSFFIDITEQKLAEVALKESEESYRELADSIAEVFFAFDEDLRYTYWNKASEELTGIPARDALGKTLYELFPDLPQTRRAEKIYRDVLRTQKPRTFVNEYELGGKYFFFEISVYPSKRGLSVFAKDVTEKKEAEDALRESEERYRSLVQNVPIAVYRTTPGPKGKFLMANPTFLKMFGLDSEVELKKMSVAEVYMNPKDRKAFSDDLLARGSVDAVELPLRRRDGTPFWGSVSARVLYDQSEGNPHFDANIVDITERKQAEQALRESEEKYRDLVERANDGITIIQDGHLKFVNQRMAEMVGYTVEEMIDTPFTRYLHPDKISESIGRYERRMGGKVVSPVSENILRHRDGSDIDVEINAGTIMYRGQVANLVIVRDITERKRVKEELEKSREQLRNLAIHLQSVREGERTAIALEIHDDLGQALTGLKMDLSWLAKKLPRDQRPLLDKTKAMTELTDATIKTVKRLSTELRPGLLDDLGLIAAIEWQADEFQNRTGITCALSVNPADIVLDRDRSTALFRIFQETLTNVARHAHATKVRVSLKEKNGIVELKVGDNGKGITEEQISDPKSFGLMGIRERVHPWRGTVKIKGAPDKGTTVTVSIPVEKSGELGN